MNKKIINDQKKTIERLQQECIEKTNAIIKLDEKNEKLEKRVEISGETIDKVIEALYPNADEDELFAIAFNGEWIDDLKERLAKLSIKEQECENNKTAHQIELDIYNQECLNLQEELKAKEQECEELKRDNATLFDKAIEARKECTDLKEQLFLLKIELEQMTALKDTYFACDHAKHEDLAKKYDQLKAENEELEKELRQKRMTILMNNDHYFEVDKTNRKLKQTLTEIKEIANYSFNLSTSELLAKLEQIIQKISEVENG